VLTLARQEPEVAGERGFSSVDLAALSRLVVTESAALADSRHIDLGVQASEAEATVKGERDALHILLANLVDNALRYTPEGGRVDVAAGMNHGRGYLEVTDSGPGIPAEDRERVFDRFYRREGTDAGGSGLGLAIVRSIAERHQARVVLSDATASGGLKVRVEFPEG
jgi:two-component system, OmpR family, sensor kinase